jgi:hypothetical protein
LRLLEGGGNQIGSVPMASRDDLEAVAAALNAQQRHAGEPGDSPVSPHP